MSNGWDEDERTIGGYWRDSVEGRRLVEQQESYERRRWMGRERLAKALVEKLESDHVFAFGHYSEKVQKLDIEINKQIHRLQVEQSLLEKLNNERDEFRRLQQLNLAKINEDMQQAKPPDYS